MKGRMHRNGCVFDEHTGNCHTPHDDVTGQSVNAEPDPISPQHYVKGGIEVRHVIRAFECTYNVGTAIAYLLRAKFKANYVEDLRKAVQHLQFELEDEGKKTP